MSTIANEWQDLPFSEAVLVNPTTSLERGKVYPFVEMSAITAGTRDVKCSEQREFSGGGSKFRDRDTLMARITPCLENGKIARFQASEGQPVGHGSTEFIVIRGRPDVSDNDFAYYLTISPEVRHFAISQMTGSSGRQRVPTDAFDAISIPLPPLDEQKAIAAVLGALDDKIALNRRMNVTLESMAQALFKKWFVDAATEKLPAGWTIRALYDCADYINGAAFRNEHFSADRQGLPIIKIGELKDGITPQTKFTEFQREPKYRITSGEILFSWSGSPDTSIDTFIWSGGDGWLNQHIFKIQFKRPIEKLFAYYLLRHLNREFIEVARNKQTTGLGHITVQDLKRMKTAFPTDDFLEEFNRVASPLFQNVYSNLCESRSLARLRDRLLPKLLIGELSVAALTRQRD